VRELLNGLFEKKAGVFESLVARVDTAKQTTHNGDLVRACCMGSCSWGM
jgi:hypothetical protein